MVRLLIICIIFLSFYSTSVFADVYDNPVKLQTISAQIPDMKSLKCKFKQEKYINNIQKPLVSSGDFEFVEGKGVYFHTTYPIDSTADYTNKNYKQINDVVNAIQSKKYSPLEKNFSFYFEQNDKDWTLGMKPKENSNTSGFISNITVTGSDYIKQIIIKQSNGNKTVIWFTK